MTKNEDKNAPGDGNNASNSMYSPAQSGTTLWQELIPVWFSFFLLLLLLSNMALLYSYSLFNKDMWK